MKQTISTTGRPTGPGGQLSSWLIIIVLALVIGNYTAHIFGDYIQRDEITGALRLKQHLPGWKLKYETVDHTAGDPYCLIFRHKALLGSPPGGARSDSRRGNDRSGGRARSYDRPKK